CPRLQVPSLSKERRVLEEPGGLKTSPEGRLHRQRSRPAGTHVPGGVNFWDRSSGSRLSRGIGPAGCLKQPVRRFPALRPRGFPEGGAARACGPRVETIRGPIAKI